jgi:hypothetical protein
VRVTQNADFEHKIDEIVLIVFCWLSYVIDAETDDRPGGGLAQQNEFLDDVIQVCFALKAQNQVEIEMQFYLHTSVYFHYQTSRT